MHNRAGCDFGAKPEWPDLCNIVLSDNIDRWTLRSLAYRLLGYGTIALGRVTPRIRTRTNDQATGCRPDSEKSRAPGSCPFADRRAVPPYRSCRVRVNAPTPVLQIDGEVFARNRLGAPRVQLTESLALLVRKREAHIGRVERRNGGQERLLSLDQRADGLRLEGRYTGSRRIDVGVTEVEPRACDLCSASWTLARAWSRAASASSRCFSVETSRRKSSAIRSKWSSACRSVACACASCASERLNATSYGAGSI